MRRASYTPLAPLAPSEPLIVVEESGGGDDEGGGSGADDDSRPASPPGCDSPLLNPCLLSPYRDMRKRSLPTPACTSGITASQVRRLSEHGVGSENAAAAAREAAFLATLQQAPPVPQPGGRRHSVVTISRAPPPSILFGRGRRESIAAFPAGALPQRVLPPRRDSTSAAPPRPPAASGASAGSTHNLQLDIMDDIAEIKAARKVRLKMWRTPSRERVCEVQPLEGSGAMAGAEAGPSDGAGPSGAQPPTRYLSRGADAASGRRYSDFACTSGASSASGTAAAMAAVAAAGAAARRRASEQPPAAAAAAAAATAAAAASARSKGAGIVCTNSDLISILSSLASSAQEINRDPEDEPPRVDDAPLKKKSPTGAGTGAAAAAAGGSGAGAPDSAEQKRSRLKSLRSNSFDVSMLLGTTPPAKDKPPAAAGAAAGDGKSAHSRSGSVGPASWFARRHQPKSPSARPPTTVAFKDEKCSGAAAAAAQPSGAPAAAAGDVAAAAEAAAVVWDGRSGSVVDAQVLGSAIEDFLARRGSGNDASGPSSPALSVPAGPTPTAPGGPKAPAKGPGAGKVGAGAGTGAGGSWFVAGKEEDDASASDTCDSSICSTLKDLFVK